LIYQDKLLFYYITVVYHVLGIHIYLKKTQQISYFSLEMSLFAFDV